MKPWIYAALLLIAGLSPAVEISYGDKRITLDAETIAKLPAVEVEASSHGEKHRYSGVLLRDVLAQVGAPLGESLRGEAIAMIVRVRAADGYTDVFALSEFDPAFGNRTILLANRQDGTPLPKNAAPFRLVIPEDTRPTRWIRQVTAIEVYSAKDK